MNAPAVEFYREHGVDLETQPLEIALCAQHNNGGLAVDCWWQTNIKGLFAAGEAAGTHGVCRPGGTALNAGQVGSRRAAEYISRRCTGALPEGVDAAARDALTWANDFYYADSARREQFQSDQGSSAASYESLRRRDPKQCGDCTVLERSW